MPRQTKSQRSPRGASPPPLIGRHNQPIGVSSWALDKHHLQRCIGGDASSKPVHDTPVASWVTPWLQQGLTPIEAAVARAQAQTRHASPLRSPATTGNIDDAPQHPLQQAGLGPHRHRERQASVQLWLREASPYQRPEEHKRLALASALHYRRAGRWTLHPGDCMALVKELGILGQADRSYSSSRAVKAQWQSQGEPLPTILRQDLWEIQPGNLPPAPPRSWASDSDCTEKPAAPKMDEATAHRIELNRRFQAAAATHGDGCSTLVPDLWKQPPRGVPASAASSVLTTWSEWQEMEASEEEARHSRGAKVGADGRRWCMAQPNVWQEQQEQQEDDDEDEEDGEEEEDEEDEDADEEELYDEDDDERDPDWHT